MALEALGKEFGLPINLLPPEAHILCHSLPAPDTMLEQSECSFVGDLLEFSLSVGESHVEFLGASDDSCSLLHGDALGDLTGVSSVVHEQQFNVFLVSDQKLSKTAGKHVTSSLGLFLTNLGHDAPAAVATALRVVDTSGSSP